MSVVMAMFLVRWEAEAGECRESLGEASLLYAEKITKKPIQI